MFFCSSTLHNSQKCNRVTKQSTIDNILAQLEVYPKTEVNKTILSRLRSLGKDNNDDYYNVNNVTYHQKCMSRFYLFHTNNVKGKPISENMSNIVSFVINYILDNSDECQFSLKEILEKYTKIHGKCELPRLDRLENQLKDHFDDDIVVYKTTHDRFICFKQTLGQCIEDSWYTNRNKNEQEEKERIVKMAAHIILQDIRAKEFDVPKTLQLFLDTLIKTHKREPKNERDKWDNKIITFAHVLMSSVRPKSFLSPILIGISSMMHTKFSARGLIDCLCNIGLCSSYSETIRFENSIINDPEQVEILADAYLQFIYDNADHNTATIDGKNTFHCMGGIMCVTPASSVTCKSKIPRLKGRIPKINTSNTSGFLPLTDFKNNKPFKLDKVKVCNWREIDRGDFSLKLKPIDLLYFFGKYDAPKSTANWHGFMNKYHFLNEDYSTTKVIPLPFIKAPPSDHRTILTALIDARLRADKNKQKHCFVTFDLPLYMKANEIIASIDPENDPYNLRSIILRLGGFHLCMSFLGAINNIMKGSGLYEAFCTMFAELSADKALSGHAFSRAVRGHLIIQAVLGALIFDKFVKLDDTEKEFLQGALQIVGDENFENFFSNPIMKNVEKKFLAAVDEIEKKRTDV